MEEENKKEKERALSLISCTEVQKINIPDAKEMQEALRNIAKEIIM